ncbi:MAG: phage antirepressor N-terminal domain-containing protein [Anaerolineales bacterium]|jgi:hypothetical protein
MKVVESYPFQFADAVFDIYWTDRRKLLLPIHELCDALGLDFSSQLQRLKRDVVLEEHVFTVSARVVRKDGVASDQDVACLSLERLHYWMGTVNHERVKPGLKEKVIFFKKEMADAVFAYFRARTLPDDMRAELDAALPPAEQAYYRMMEQASSLGQQVGEHGARLKGLEERMKNLEARLVGTDFINMQQAKQFTDAVGVLGSMLKEKHKKGASPFAIIQSEVKKKFQVPSYQLIPESEFPAVMEFLAKWWAREAPERPVPEIFVARQNRLL